MSDGSQVDAEIERLVSVVPLLPPRSIQFLLTQSTPRQEMVVRQIRSILDFWDVNHVSLDPVQQEFVLDAIVVSLVSVAVGFEQAVSAMVATVQPQCPAGEDCSELHGDQGAG